MLAIRWLGNYILTTYSDVRAVAPEQYLTIAIPGTTIDVRDIKDGGTFIYGAEYSAFPPLAVSQAEARLVDNMIPLANIMVRKHSFSCRLGVWFTRRAITSTR